MSGSRNILRLILSGLIAVTGLAVCVPLSDVVSANRPALDENYGDSDLSLQGAKLKGFVLGSEGLVADWYWMRALQYIGGKMVKHENEDINMDDLRGLNPRLLYPLLDNATDLDPHFIAAYGYGAIVMPAIDPQKAIDITKKGIANNPNEWRLYQHLGYIYWKLKRYDDAANTYEKGAAILGAAPFMELMGAAIRNQGGSRSVARAMFQQMYDGAADDSVKLTAQRRLQKLQAEDELDALNAKLVEHKDRTGRCVGSLMELLPALSGVKLPVGDFRLDTANRLVDPTDVPYILKKEECVAAIDLEHTGYALQN